MAKDKRIRTTHIKTVELHFLPDDMSEEEKRLRERILANSLLDAYRKWVADGKPTRDRSERGNAKPKEFIHGSIVQLDQHVPANECRRWQLRAASDPDVDGVTSVLCKRFNGTREDAEAYLASMLDSRCPEPSEEIE